jgi:aminoglycoside phosphotransferase family enzyme
MSKKEHLSQKEVIECLGKEKTYPHKISKIITEETHISWIFLTGSYAYKIKVLNLVKYSISRFYLRLDL